MITLCGISISFVGLVGQAGRWEITHRIPGNITKDSLIFFSKETCSPLMSAAGIANIKMSQARDRPEFTEYTSPHVRQLYVFGSTCHSYGQSPVTGLQWKIRRKIWGRYAAKRVVIAHIGCIRCGDRFPS